MYAYVGEEKERKSIYVKMNENSLPNVKFAASTKKKIVFAGLSVCKSVLYVYNTRCRNDRIFSQSQLNIP